MDVAVNVGQDSEFAKMVAHLMVEEIKPMLPDMVQQAVEELVPQRGMTRAKVREMICIANDQLASEIIDRPDFPKYPAGTQWRYWPRAVDRYLTEHNLS